jgi:hypothetical protein
VADRNPAWSRCWRLSARAEIDHSDAQVARKSGHPFRGQPEPTCHRHRVGEMLLARVSAIASASCSSLSGDAGLDKPSLCFLRVASTSDKQPEQGSSSQCNRAL